MAELPSDIMYNMLSRIPVKSLARFRCVSKLWFNYINDPYLEAMHAKRAAVHDNSMLIMLQKYSFGCPNSPCILRFLECKEAATSTCSLEVRKKPPAMEFMSENGVFRYCQGSCNGLLYSSKREGVFKNLFVINPLRGECYELPPVSTPCYSGLGFDDSTNTFKMVCIEVRKQVVELPKFTMEEKLLCPMVHVLGTDSWREIPQALSYSLRIRGIRGDGVFANGCLYWLTDYRRHDSFYVIRFDLKTEEFGLIKPPKHIYHEYSRYDIMHLVDLHCQLGLVYVMLCRLEVWVLKEGGWVMHCEFEQKQSLFEIEVLGFWNENGDILLRSMRKKPWFVYNLKSDSLIEVNVVGWKEGCAEEIWIYQSSLSSTLYSIKSPRKKAEADPTLFCGFPGTDSVWKNGKD